MYLAPKQTWLHPVGKTCSTQFLSQRKPIPIPSKNLLQGKPNTSKYILLFLRKTSNTEGKPIPSKNPINSKTFLYEKSIPSKTKFIKNQFHPARDLTMFVKTFIKDIQNTKKLSLSLFLWSTTCDKTTNIIEFRGVLTWSIVTMAIYRSIFSWKHVWLLSTNIHTNKSQQTLGLTNHPILQPAHL